MSNVRQSRLSNPNNPPNAFSQGFMNVAVLMNQVNAYSADVQNRELSTNLSRVSKRLNLSATVPLPAVAGTAIVLSYTVPFGWVGYINNFVQLYQNGAGFVDGSGDLLWSIKISNYAPYGYGNMTTQQGSLTNSSLTSDTGIRIRSNQIITHQVEWNGNNLVGGTLLCALLGWVAPDNAGKEV